MKMERVDLPDGTVELKLTLTDEDARTGVLEQAGVFWAALRIHEQRTEQYGDNWRRKGWRGSLFQLRNAVERAWDSLWAAPPGRTMPRNHTPHDTDDLMDAINYAAFTIRQVGSGDRDGSWSYPS